MNLTLEQFLEMEDSLPDSAMQVLGYPNNRPTTQEQLDYFNELPQEIKNEAISWGLSDSVFRDRLYEFIND